MLACALLQCTASAYDVESGCVPEGAVGICVNLVGDDYTCVTSESVATAGTVSTSVNKRFWVPVIPPRQIP